jgi:hypothetical protein
MQNCLRNLEPTNQLLHSLLDAQAYIDVHVGGIRVRTMSATTCNVAHVVAFSESDQGILSSESRAVRQVESLEADPRLVVCLIGW